MAKGNTAYKALFFGGGEGGVVFVFVGFFLVGPTKSTTSQSICIAFGGLTPPHLVFVGVCWFFLRNLNNQYFYF